MKSELIVDVQPDEIAIALTEDDRLQEINREKRGEDIFAVGNIYLGRVRKVMPALNAVFVDVGHEKEAFLHYLDLGAHFRSLRSFVNKALADRRKVPVFNKTAAEEEVGKEGQIADLLKVGDLILVQVIKEPINSKGPRLTAEINLAGRNMVLIPCADKVMVSQKIRREAERGRLKQLLQAIKPHGFGVIVRTMAEDKRAAELDNELRILLKRWEETVRSLQQPAKGLAIGRRDAEVRLVSEELGRTIGIIRDVFSTDFETIQINDQAIFEEVRQYVELIAPDKVNIVRHYTQQQPIFDRFDITRQMKTGLGRTVGFKHGGYLIIDRTEALFAIDVNSGSKKIFEDQEQNAFQFNMLAADEIAHQLRLRDIGGIIIVDFIDMDSKDNQQTLFEHMKELMERDRARHNVLPLTKFGLMQITRQRVRPAVEIDVTELCPMCMGKGRVQPSILFTDTVQGEIERYVSRFGRGLRLELHPYVYAYVSKGWILGLKAKWQRRFGIKVTENQSLGMLDMRFLDAKGNKLHIPHEEETEQNVWSSDNKQAVVNPTQKAEVPVPVTAKEPPRENGAPQLVVSKPKPDREQKPVQPETPVKQTPAPQEKETSVAPVQKAPKQQVAKKKAEPKQPAEAAVSEPVVAKTEKKAAPKAKAAKSAKPAKPAVPESVETEKKEQSAQERSVQEDSSTQPDAPKKKAAPRKRKAAPKKTDSEQKPEI